MSSTEIPLDQKPLPRLQDPAIALLINLLESNRVTLLERWRQQQDRIAVLDARLRALENSMGSA